MLYPDDLNRHTRSCHRSSAEDLVSPFDRYNKQFLQVFVVLGGGYLACYFCKRWSASFLDLSSEDTVLDLCFAMALP